MHNKQITDNFIFTHCFDKVPYVLPTGAHLLHLANPKYHQGAQFFCISQGTNSSPSSEQVASLSCSFLVLSSSYEGVSTF